MCNKVGVIYNTTQQTHANANLTFTSWIQEIDIAPCRFRYGGSFIFKRRHTGSLIEAQAASKAIVSTDVGGIENVVLPGKSALLSASDDVNALAQNMFSVVTNDTLRMDMSKWGTDHVNRNFNYTRLVSDMTKLYDQLLGI
jgi:glycosyltransferase involved in cell wall biosynthesis